MKLDKHCAMRVVILVQNQGCWLLFDFVFYGNLLFQPAVLQQARGIRTKILG